VRTRHVSIAVEGRILKGDLALPELARGVVLFAHGSGSGRLSPRNQFVARLLNQQGLNTLLIDLLSEEEEQEDAYSGSLRFDIGLLAERLDEATSWLLSDPDVQGQNVGLFGASTGAGAALVAAARRPEDVKAVVSRGGRPDLADAVLPDVEAATLLIVGSLDYPVIPLNEQAFDRLGCREKKIEIVSGASHLFEEPGKLEQVAELAANWFVPRLR
jgi:putative phosphoribosyl transferase